MFKRILVPLDGSRLAEGVLPHVKALASYGATDVILIRVATHQFSTFYLDDPQVVKGLLEADRAECQSYLNTIASDLRQAGFKVETIVCEGLAPHMILETAESQAADLIAMSTHGRTGMGRWLIGSVADKVVHGSKVPVLLVRPETPAQA